MLGIAQFLLARAGAGQAACWLEEDKRGQENQEGGRFPLPQGLEVSQRQQETLSSPRGPHPVSKNADFCAQSKVELVGMCVHPQHRAGEGGGRAHPVDTGRWARLTVMTMTKAVAMVIVNCLSNTYSELHSAKGSVSTNFHSSPVS